MASNAPRQLLRGASCHAPPSRPLATTSTCRPLPRASPYTYLPIRSYNPRPKQKIPPAPPPPERSAYAKKAEERALLSKLSTLSPDQITALLSGQPETTIPPPPSGPTYTYAPSGSGGKTWRQKLQPVFFALVAIVLGNMLGQKAIYDNEALRVLDEFEEDERGGGDKVHTGEERSLSAFVNMAMLLEGGGLELMGLPNYGVYSVNPSGLVTYMYSGWIKPGYITDKTGRPILIEPDDATVVPEGVFDGEGKAVCWPAHMRLLDRTGITNELAARKKQHLVAGAYGCAGTLGGIYQIVQDPDTNDLSVLVTFGKRMAGPVGIIHTGAIATVLDESMGRLAMRTLPSKTAVTAKLVLRYSDRVQPSIEGLFKIQLDVLTKEAARDLENNLRIDATYEMDSDGRAWRLGSTVSVQTSSPTGRGKPPPEFVELDQVQTDKKVWIRARMYTINQRELVCEAKGLFVVPKDVELEQLGDHW